MSTQITYLGHSSVLFQNSSLSFFTDPVFSQRILFLKRHDAFKINPETLPQPSAIFVSHAHYDHLDIPSFKYFSSKAPIILPYGLGRLVSKFVKNPLIELRPHESSDITPGLKVTAFPVKHVGFRLSGLTYRECVGYWIEANGMKIFFPGDTAYRPDFQSFKGPDVALLPIGPCHPEKFMRKVHLNPPDALQVAEEIEAKLTIPIHWGTFRLSTEPLNEPIEHFKRLVAERNLGERIRVLTAGECLLVNQ